MSSLAGPQSPASPSGAPGLGGRRALAATALLVGGILAGAGLFLPWVRVHYPAVAGDPALTVYDLPGRVLAQALHDAVFAPHRFSLGLLVDAQVLLDVPLLFAVLGAIAVLSRGWVPSRRLRVVGVVLAAAGAAWSIMTAYVFVNIVGSFDVVRGTRTLQQGAGVTLLGSSAPCWGCCGCPRVCSRRGPEQATWSRAIHIGLCSVVGESGASARPGFAAGF
jgi:hypothetical protein